MTRKRVEEFETKPASGPSPRALGDEREFAARLAARDESAWRDFLDIYADTLYSHFYYTLRRHSFTVPRDEVDDCFQDLLEKLLEDGGRRLLSFEGRENCSFGSWLRVVCVNHALELIRRRKPTFSLDALGPEKTHQLLKKKEPMSVESPRRTVEREASIRAVEKAVKGFSSRDRLLFNLYYRDERSRTEIATFLRIRPNHVDQILYRMRERIRTAILDADKV
jgi:RNA polymerase sigma-70 factor (ECF subfamily)